MCANFVPDIPEVFLHSDDEEEEFEGFDGDDIPLIHFANQNRADSDIEVEVRSDSEDEDENIEDDESDSDGELEHENAINWTANPKDLTFEDFEQDSGPKHDLPADAKTLQYFKLFFSDDVIDLIIRNTELYAAMKIAEKRRAGKQEADFTSSREEINAYI